MSIDNTKNKSSNLSVDSGDLSSSTATIKKESLTIVGNQATNNPGQYLNGSLNLDLFASLSSSEGLNESSILNNTTFEQKRSDSISERDQLLIRSKVQKK